MKEEIKFIKNFIKLDYAVRIAQLNEPDSNAFKNSLNKLNKYYHGNISSDIHQGNREPVDIDDAEIYIKSLQPKKLFKMNFYKHTIYQDLCSIYLSSQFLNDCNYFSINYISKIDKEFRIIAEYYICDNCQGTGFIDKKICDKCFGKGYVWQGGIKIKIKGEPFETIEFERPVNMIKIKEE